MKTLSDKELVEIVDRAMKKFKGNMSRFSNAVGYLFIARKFGWRVALLMHDRKSVKDYEKILGINSREVFPEIGPLAEKSVAYWALKKVTNFWKAVRGEIPGVRSTEIRS